MAKDNTFIYNSFNFKIHQNKLNIEYHFTIYDKEKFDFTPTLEFIIPEKYFTNDNKLVVLNKLVFNLGMVEAISYWKATCARNFHINASMISNNQKLWWQNLYYYGLGEFRYLNNIKTSKEEFVNFISNQIMCSKKKVLAKSNQLVNDNISSYSPSLNSQKNNKKQVIIPIGGGKDSVVTIEEFKNKKFNILPFIINPSKTTLDCVDKSGISKENVIVVNRNLDKTILKLNDLGYLNGHTPFSAIVAFCSLIAAELTNTSYIALSNEASANEATVNTSDDIINHQYSKTIYFESSFRNYYKRYISDKYNYFSYLRNLNELQIAEKFANLKQYHNVFKSCNVGSKQNIWCCNCSKCLFVYIMLMPFLSKDELTNIFGEDLMENKGLLNTLFELTGIADKKPFECVGTISETRAAIAFYLKNNKPYGILVDYINKISPEQIEGDFNNFEKLLKFNNKYNYIPNV